MINIIIYNFEFAHAIIPSVMILPSLVGRIIHNESREIGTTSYIKQKQRNNLKLIGPTSCSYSLVVLVPIEYTFYMRFTPLTKLFHFTVAHWKLWTQL